MRKLLCLIFVTVISGCTNTRTSDPKTLIVVEAAQQHELDCRRLGLTSGRDMYGKDLEKAFVEVANNADVIGANAVTILNRDNTGGYVFVVALFCNNDKLARLTAKNP